MWLFGLSISSRVRLEVRLQWVKWKSNDSTSWFYSYCSLAPLIINEYPRTWYLYSFGGDDDHAIMNPACKTVMITEGSSGAGFAAASELLANDANVSHKLLILNLNWQLPCFSLLVPWSSNFRRILCIHSKSNDTVLSGETFSSSPWKCQHFSNHVTSF